MTDPGLRLEDLPPRIQDAIKRRSRQVDPIREAIRSLELSWEITRGNMEDLIRALQVFEGDRWREIHGNGPAAHRYHRDVLRLFHNFLSASVSAVWHAERIVSRVKKIAPQVYRRFERQLKVLDSGRDYRVLRELRDHAIHGGHHVTVLTMRDGFANTGEHILIRSVCFDISLVRSAIEQQHRGTRARAKRQDLAQLVTWLNDFPEHPEMRGVVESYFEHVGALMTSLRAELIDLNIALNARPIETWLVP